MTAASKKRYEKIRRERQNQTREFIAIDSEGGAHGESYEHEGKVYQPHKSFLWGGGDCDGRVSWLYDTIPLAAGRILDFLLDMAQANPGAIFVSFAFGYDVAQILTDLPYEKAWELQHGKPWHKRDNPDERRNGRRSCFWRDYAISYIKGKSFTIRVVSDVKRTPDGKRKPVFSRQRRVRVYDVYGFFQGQSFLRAIKSMPGVATPAEYSIVEAGKAARGMFYHSDIATTKEYTRHELTLLCRMMNRLRDALAGQDIFPVTWQGAGSIAQALLKREETKRHLGAVVGRLDETTEIQSCAHRAYFGGRIELCKQGATHERLFGYDVSSAYPFHASSLPSMGVGSWSISDQADCESLSPLSMLRVRGQFLAGLPFYPLPYRTKDGSIYFPQQVYGVYMADEVRAALEFIARFGGHLEIEKIWAFDPHSDASPFDFLRQMFEYRRSLAKGDITELVVKLGINSVYGKLAQGVGEWREAPALASPWHAAAITARTRAQLLRAAMTDPEAVIMFATDGLFTTRPLPIECAKTKTFGAWDGPSEHEGGVFVQSGVYALGRESFKSRGFRPENASRGVADLLWRDIPPAWKEGAKNYEFSYKSYMTLGASVASKEQWDRCGQWVTGERTLALEPGRGGKRALEAPARERRARARRLVDTVPNSLPVEWSIDDKGELLLSELHKTEWLDDGYGEQSANDAEQEAIANG